MYKKSVLSRLNLGHLQFIDGWLECWHTFDSLMQNIESLHVEYTEIIGGVLVCEGQERLGDGLWVLDLSLGMHILAFLTSCSYLCSFLGICRNRINA